MGQTAPLTTGTEHWVSDAARGRAVLWDVDGTLIDSAEHHFRAWQETMAAHGRPITRADFTATFGQRNDAVLRHYLGRPVTEQEIDRIGGIKEERYRALIRAQGVEALAGVREWLGRLRGAGWRQAIASSGPRQNCETILEVLQVADAFDAIVSAEDVRHGKPHPEVFLVAAARLGVAPGRCVVVEDAPAGVEAGHAAGMHTLGVLSTHPHLDAERVVHALTDLEPDAFERLVGDGD